MTMSGFDAYKTYLAVNNHFRNKSYDYFKYNGIVKANQESYTARKDRYFFEKMGKRFDHDELLKYLVSNFCESSDGWVGELLTGEKEIVYKKWKKRIESLTYSFEQDVDLLRERVEDFNILFVASGKSHPFLYKAYLMNKISLETMLILEYLVGYSRLWEKQSDMMLSEFVITLNKYKPFFFHFVQPQKDKWKKIVLDRWNK